MSLPTDASEASRKRYGLARELADSCPPELAREIALTGSASRGVADEYSDAELNVWADHLPAPERRWAWLEGAGVTHLDAAPYQDSRDGTWWQTCRFRDVWLEIGWATIEDYEQIVTALTRGEYVGHEHVSIASFLQRAIVLRTEGVLVRWQRALQLYPDSLVAAIIRNQTEVWSDPHVPGVRRALAARGQRFALAMRLQWDIQNVLRVLFALNRRWDQDWKWTDTRSLDFAVMPDGLSRRIDQIFTLVDLPSCVTAAFQLIEETLLLVPPPHDVSLALSNIQTALREGSHD